MRERVDLKSPVREYRSPGSVRGTPGNRRPYLDKCGKGAGEVQGPKSGRSRKAKGGTTEKLKLGAGRREVKSKTHSKARNSPANSGDAFAPARAFSRRALPAGWCGLSSRLLTASAKSATFTPRPLP